jgi:hypothetical protein
MAVWSAGNFRSLFRPTSINNRLFVREQGERACARAVPQKAGKPWRGPELF